MDEKRRQEIVDEFCLSVGLSLRDGVLGGTPPIQPSKRGVMPLHGPFPRVHSPMEPRNPYLGRHKGRTVEPEPDSEAKALVALIRGEGTRPQKPTGPINTDNSIILEAVERMRTMNDDNATMSPRDQEATDEKARSTLAAAVLNAQAGTLTFSTDEQLAAEVLRTQPALKPEGQSWQQWLNRVRAVAKDFSRPSDARESAMFSLLAHCPAVMSEERRREVVAIACQSAHLSLDPGGYSGVGYNPGGKSNVGAGTAELKAEQHLWNSVNRTLSSRREEVVNEFLGLNKAGDMLWNASEKAELKRLVDEALEASRWLSDWKTQVWLGDKTKRAQKSLDTGVKCDGLIEELKAAVEAAAWQGAGR